MPKVAFRTYALFVVMSVAMSACIPTSSTIFAIDRADPLGDAQELHYVCDKLGMTLTAPWSAADHESPKGTFVCESAPSHGYFIVIKPDVGKKQINVYFAERAPSFSPEAKAVYLNLARELQQKFGAATISAPTI